MRDVRTHQDRIRDNQNNMVPGTWVRLQFTRMESPSELSSPWQHLFPKHIGLVETPGGPGQLRGEAAGAVRSGDHLG